MQDTNRYYQEIVNFHEFLAGWYTGQLDKTAIERITTTVAPEFKMVSPDGHCLDRDDILKDISEGFGRVDPGSLEIEVRNVEILQQFDDHALVRFEEWRTVNGEESARLSTSLFREISSDPDNLLWLDVHETWIN